MNHISLLKMIQNTIGIHRKYQVTPRIDVKINRGYFLHQQNIMTVSHKGRVYMQPHLIRIINTEVNILIVIVECLVLSGHAHLNRWGIFLDPCWPWYVSKGYICPKIRKIYHLQANPL